MPNSNSISYQDEDRGFDKWKDDCTLEGIDWRIGTEGGLPSDCDGNELKEGETCTRCGESHEIHNYMDSVKHAVEGEE